MFFRGDERAHVSRQVQTEVKKYKEEAPGSAQTEKGEPKTKAWGVQEDVHREKRTEPMQLYPRLAEGRPIAYRRGTRQSSRCDLVWSPRRVGDPGHGHWRCRGPRLSVHQKGRAREVSESPADSAVEVAEPLKRNVLQRVSPSLPVCKSPTRSSPTPGCDILQRRLRVDRRG